MFHTLKKEIILAALIFSFIESAALETLIPNTIDPTSSTLGNTSHVSTTQYCSNSDPLNPDKENLTPCSLIPKIFQTNPTCCSWSPSTYFIYKPELKEDEELVVFMVRGVLITVLAMFGIIANIIAMIIFSWPGVMNPTTFILRGLAFCDTLTILCSLATRGFPFLGIDSLEYFGSIIAPIAFPMAVTWFTGSVYTTMLLSFERYSGIVLGKRIHFKEVYHYMVSIGLFSIITNIPLFWSFKWEKAELNLDVYCNKTFQYAALLLPHAILKFVVPTLFLIFTNFFTVTEIRKANNTLEETIGSIPNCKRFRRREIQLTKQILVVIGAFIICNICTVAVAIKSRTHSFQNHTHLLVSIGDLFITLNCSLNVIIYGIFSPKFRAIFKKIFCSCFKKKSEGGKPVFHISSMSKQQSKIP